MKENSIPLKHRLLSIGLTIAIVASCFLALEFQGEAVSATSLVKTMSTANNLVKQGGSRGIDVSMWQGQINWKQVAQDDVDFVFVRSSYGQNSDPYFVYNATNARANGLKVGAYHYAHFRSTAQMKAEARYFVSQLKKVNINYPVVLDVENHYGLSKAQLTRLVLDFIEIVEEEGYTVMLYSYTNFINGHLSTPHLENTKLWVANYVQQPKGVSHSIWQHTSQGRVKGIQGDVDLNVAYGAVSAPRAAAPKVQPMISRGSGADSSSPLPSYATAPKTNSNAVPLTVKSSSGTSFVPRSQEGQLVSLSADTSKPLPKTTTATPIAAEEAPTPEPENTSQNPIGMNLSQIDGKAINYGKNFLNSTYEANIPMKGNVQLPVFHTAIAKSLQHEAGISETGFLTTSCVDALDAIDFALEENQNIVKLLQAKLLYAGYYNYELTGKLDETTAEALAKYQDATNIPRTGDFDVPTIHNLFGIKVL